MGAQDSRDLGGQSVCAGINDSTQTFPTGYEGVYFVAVQFPDGNRISAGFVRSASGRQDFGLIQNNGNGLKQGVQVAGPVSGSHTYCVTHSGSNWVMTDDGKTIYTTTAESASSIGGQLQFESSAQHFDSASPMQSFSLVVPGFHDIAVDGNPPTQLSGFTVTS